MTPTIDAKVAGRFKLLATNIHTGKVRVLADWFDNLIVDAGLNRLAVTSCNVLQFAMVGTGTTTPANSQTTLTNRIASSSTTSVADVTGVDPGGATYSYVRRNYRFAAGTATGNLTEVGVGWSTTSIFSRTLIKDEAGDPTTITVLADEFLDVLYEFRIYIPADVTGTVDISGTSYDYTIRPTDFNPAHATSTSNPRGWNPSNVAFYGIDAKAVGGYFFAFSDQSLPAISTALSGSGEIGVASTNTATAYVDGSFERNYVTTYGLASPTADIGRLNLIGGIGWYSAIFTPKIPKTSVNVLTLNWKVQWARKVI